METSRQPEQTDMRCLKCLEKLWSLNMHYLYNAFICPQCMKWYANLAGLIYLGDEKMHILEVVKALYPYADERIKIKLMQAVLGGRGL